MQRHRPRGDQVSRPFQPGHVDQIDDRFADVVPRRQCTVRVVVEVQSGREDSRRERVGRIVSQRATCVVRRSAPLRFQYVNASEFAPRRRGCGALSGRELEQPPGGFEFTAA